MKKIKLRKGFLSLFLSFILAIGASSWYETSRIASAAETETVVTSWTALQGALGSSGEKTVIIGADITANSGSMIEIPSGAKITLKANGSYKISASGSFPYGLILVKSGAQLVIDANDMLTFTNPSGYFLDIKGNVTMNSGTFTGNKGGAINIPSGGLFEMNGGVISNNTGLYGGAVHIEKGGHFIMNSGTISNNTATGAGGGVYVEGEFTMNGGAISNNSSANDGGGIYNDNSGKITIHAGDFFNNTATKYGGAFGTGGQKQAVGTLVYNAVIAGNKADKGTGRGGGIWSCPVGTVSIAESSVVIGGNSALKSGDQLCIESSTIPVIPAKMLNDESYEWYWDMANKRYPGTQSTFTNGSKPSNYDSSGITLTNKTVINATGLAALKAEFRAGKVFIYNNTADCGGGVGGNGSISFLAAQLSEPTPVPGPKVQIKKVDSYDDSSIDDQYLEDMVFELWKKGSSGGYDELFASLNYAGGFKSDELDDGYYQLKETVPPTGYSSNSDMAEFTVLNGNITMDQASEKFDLQTPSSGSYVYVVVVKNAKSDSSSQYTSLTVEKVWDGDNSVSRPASVHVQLYKDGAPDGDVVTLDSSNSWRYTWNNLDKTYRWTVDETDVPDGYSKSISDESSENGIEYKIINKKLSEQSPLMSLTVEKVWVGNDASTSPAAIEVQLYKDSFPDGAPVTLGNSNNWSYTWDNLDGARAWAVDEVAVPDGYTRKISINGNKYTITNEKVSSYTNPTTEETPSTLKPTPMSILPLPDSDSTGDNPSETENHTPTPSDVESPPSEGSPSGDSPSEGSPSGGSSSEGSPSGGSPSGGSPSGGSPSGGSPSGGSPSGGSPSGGSPSGGSPSGSSPAGISPLESPLPESLPSESPLETEIPEEIPSVIQELPVTEQFVEMPMTPPPETTFELPTMENVPSLDQVDPDRIINTNNVPQGYTVVQLDDDVFIIYDDEGVPLGYLIIPDAATIDDIDLLEEMVPFGAVDIKIEQAEDKKSNPKTSDTAKIVYVYAAWFVFAANIVAQILLSLRKRLQSH